MSGIKSIYGQRGSLLGAALLAFCLWSPVPSFAQTNEQLINRINQLENQVQTLSRAVYRGKMPVSSGSAVSAEPLPSTGSVAGYEMRIADLETQVRSMTGQIEKQTYDIEQMKNHLNKALADNDLRFSQIERGGASASSSSSSYEPQKSLTHDETTTVVSGSGTSTVTDAGSPEQLYESAFALVREGRYDQAEQKFQSFLDHYSDHMLAANAQYWLSETFYVRGDYPKSAKMFAQGYQKYPKSSKAADNLLKLGLSLAKMGKKEDACLSFSQMQKEFAGDTGPVIRRVAQEKKTLGCE